MKSALKKARNNRKRLDRSIKTSKRKAFTLIELLIIIAILGILAAAVLVAINPGKRMGQARDAQRKTDLAQIRNALEAYSVTHGSYPNPAVWGDWGWTGSSRLPWLQDLIDSGDIKVAPKDQLNTDNPEYHYYYRANKSGGSDYCIMLAFETVPTTDPNFLGTWANSNKYEYGPDGTKNGYECTH